MVNTKEGNADISLEHFKWSNMVQNYFCFILQISPPFMHIIFCRISFSGNGKFMWRAEVKLGLQIEWGYNGEADAKESACNAGSPGSIPGSGRSPGEGNGNPLQYSFLENPMDRGAWQATIHGVAKSQTRLSDWIHTIHIQGPRATPIPSPLL